MKSLNKRMKKPLNIAKKVAIMSSIGLVIKNIHLILPNFANMGALAGTSLMMAGGA